MSLILEVSSNEVLDGQPMDGDKPCPASAVERAEYLQQCVEDLVHQNRTLVKAVMDLEAETENRVRAAEKFLDRTAKSAKTYMVALNIHEQFIRNLVKGSLASFSSISRLQHQVSLLEEQNASLQERNDGLCHDIGSLVRLIGHARNTGDWDVGNIDFCEVSFEDVFGSVDQFSNRTSLEELDRIESASMLSNSSAVDDYGIRTLFGERTSSVQSYCSSVRTFGGGLKPLTRRDAQLHRLQSELRYAQQLVSSVNVQLSDRDRTIASLQVEIADLNHYLATKQTQFEVLNRMVEPMGRPTCTEPRAAQQPRTPDERLMSCIGHRDTDLSSSELHDRLCHANADSASSKREKLKLVLLRLNRENARLRRDLGSAAIGGGGAVVKDLEDVGIQVDFDGELLNKMRRLKGLEERQRLKAFGLEVVVQQLTAEVESCRATESAVQTEVERLREQVADSEDKIHKLEETVTSRDNDIELLRYTIENLRDKIVALKRRGHSEAQVDEAQSSKDEVKLSLPNSSVMRNGVFAHSNGLLSRTRSKSGEIFDI